jgi:4-amino-4-deoxy-L-arabinose transferase-like glycosyltransferase
MLKSSSFGRQSACSSVAACPEHGPEQKRSVVLRRSSVCPCGQHLLLAACKISSVTKPYQESRSFRAPWTIFWTALIVRLAYMTLAHTFRMRTWDQHFAFGYEMGRIAQALATGYGYADPFHGHSGPTAWVPPLYPLILAAVFKLFGVYSTLSAWIILAFNCVLSAFTIPAIYEIAARCFNRRVALWSAWLWALYPAAMQYAVKWVWEMTLTTFLFAWVLVLTLRMREIGDPSEETSPSQPVAASQKRWAIFGPLWGLIGLSNPSLLLFLPVCGLWILAGTRAAPRPEWKRQIACAVLASGVFFACLAPWTYRNWRAFHKIIPMRSNLGVELYLGNGPGATGLLMEFDHPFQALDQFRLYRQMGEIDYAKMRGERAKRIILADPARFVKLSIIRFYYFWFSVPHPGDEGFLNEYGRNFNYQFTSIAGLFGLLLALRRRAPAAGLFAWAFALLPLTYYFVTVHARFRHPLEPLIAIYAVYLFQSAEKSWKITWFSPGRKRHEFD